MTRLLRRCLLLSTCLAASVVLAETRITILADAFGKPDSRLARDWGYGALIEHEGKRILFDTGNDAAMFEQNIKALKIDLSRLDAVVISHRHGDHTAGLHYLQRVNPSVRIFVPDDEHFGGPTPAVFFRHKDESLPPEMRYFGGKPPQVVPHGSAWRGFSFVVVEKPTEIIAGIRVIPVVSKSVGTMDLKEISLSIQTQAGQVILVGCAHPGILQIVEAAAAFDPRIHLVAGGLHLVTTDEPEVRRIGLELRDKWGVEQIAPGHCTGEHAFAALKRMFGDRYVYAGVGTVIRLVPPAADAD